MIFVSLVESLQWFRSYGVHMIYMAIVDLLMSSVSCGSGHDYLVSFIKMSGFIHEI